MQVNITKFRKDLPVYLHFASAGEEVTITSKGRIIARLMPPSSDEYETDETTYLLSSPANAKRLKRARNEIETGDLAEIENIADLDKLIA